MRKNPRGGTFMGKTKTRRGETGVGEEQNREVKFREKNLKCTVEKREKENFRTEKGKRYN